VVHLGHYHIISLARMIQMFCGAFGHYQIIVDPNGFFVCFMHIKKLLTYFSSSREHFHGMM